MSMELFSWPLATAVAPLLWLILGLAVFRLKALYVCPAALVLAICAAVAVWDFSPRLSAEAVADGAVFAVVPILWVIVAAFFMYTISLHTGADRAIKDFLAALSPDPRIQALIIAWGFGSFMEAAAGFGTAVVIPAALLISLGFGRMLAAVVSLLANTIAVAFGVVGIPMQTLAWVTDLDLFALSAATVWQLGLLTLAVPFCIVFCVTRSVAGTYGVWGPTLAAGVTFVLAQYAVALSLGPELAAMAGAMASVLSVLVVVRLFPVQKLWVLEKTESDATLLFEDAYAPQENAEGGVQAEAAPASVSVANQGACPLTEAHTSWHVLVKAWSPYMILLLLVIITSRLFPLLHESLLRVQTILTVYSGPGGKGLVIPWLITPGTLVFTAAVAGGVLQGASFRQMLVIWWHTCKKLAPTCVVIISIVCMAKVLSYSGMMGRLSEVLSALAGQAYPVVSPFVGALGSFVTGSDTSSNILFGALQKQTALYLGLDPVWLAAANTSGACIGKLLSPQNIALAAVSVGLEGQEGRLLRLGLMYAVPFLLFLGFWVYLGT